MKKILIIILGIFLSISAYSQSNFDIVIRKATQDSIKARNDSIYIKSPSTFKENAIFENIGIGTSNPLSALHINKGTGSLSTGLSFGTDGNSGFYEAFNDQLWIATGASVRYQFNVSELRTDASTAWALKRVSASATSPTFTPKQSDSNSGIGQNAADQVSIIAGGKEIARASENVTEQFIINPQADYTGTAAAPSLAFADGTFGIYAPFNDQIYVTLANANRYYFNTSNFGGLGTGGGLLRYSGGSLANNTFSFQGDLNTGITRLTADEISFATGGVEAMRLTEDTVFVDSTFAPLQIKFPDGTIQTTASSGGGFDQDINANLIAGDNAGAGLTTGTDNIFIGENSGKTLSIGQFNTAIGTGTFEFANSYSGIAIGYQALRSNTTGNYNIALGYKTGYYNTTGEKNIFLGQYAGGGNTATATDIDNSVMIGYNAGWKTTSDNQTFIGHESGYSNTSGANNTFLGYQSGYSNLTGGYNTFMGYQSGYANTGQRNTFIGGLSGFDNLGGEDGTFIGYNAGANNTTGEKNVFLGGQSGFTNTTGLNNTYLGYFSGRNSTGSNNVFLGYQAGTNETGSNKLYIENSTSATPLIGGDFSTNTVTINDTLQVTGAIKGTVQVISQDVVYTESTLQSFLTLPDGAVIKEVIYEVHTIFDGTLPQLQIGTNAMAETCLSTFDLDEVEFKSGTSTILRNDSGTTETYYYRIGGSSITQGSLTFYLYYTIF